MTNVIEEKNENYPVKIKECLSDYKPIYYRGNLSLLDKPSIAIVGSRKASAYGKSCARALAKCAVEYGAVVVSGLALGIDSEAHSACLENGGETIAVLANGVDVFYPKRNQAMQKRIEETYAFEPNFNKAVENLLKIYDEYGVTDSKLNLILKNNNMMKNYTKDNSVILKGVLDIKEK